MAITLAQAKVGMADKVDQMVVDEFRRNSTLLEKLTFDDAVSSGTGGSTLTYGYTRLKTPAKAGFREINNEYTAQEAEREKKTVDLGHYANAEGVAVPCVGIVDVRKPNGTDIVTSLTDLFAMRTAMNGFHGVTVKGDKIIKTYLPD